MFLGIDLGTTEVKVLLLCENHSVKAIKRYALSIQRPQPLWSEQEPHEWWEAVCTLLDQYAVEMPSVMADIKAIGLSGQMHGAVVLDAQHQVLRPAILWNDGRSSQECHELKERVPNIEQLSGNLVMPGFTAPKLCWLKRHEPALFKKIAKVLLPKDYLRYCLSGDIVTDCSDASGTLWIDVQQRAWSETLFKGCDLTIDHMPRLIESNEASGMLHPYLAKRWGIKNEVIIAGGAGDNAASAIGIGAIQPGQGFVSLGTSGVIFICNDHYRPNPAAAIHAFCHALPNRWHQMSVMLSAASSLSWVSRLTGQKDESEALGLAATLSPKRRHLAPLFLPYLSGERTPHNNPHAQGLFFGLTHQHEAADLIYSVIEGVSFGLLDGLQGLKDPSSTLTLSLVGGGTRSSLWAQLIADTLNLPLATRSGSEAAGALGAARLARIAQGGNIEQTCLPMPVLERFEPDTQQQSILTDRYDRFKSLYGANLPYFASFANQ
ncbi:MAG: xylulokinase [Pseudomonadota bacterium]